MATWPDPQPGLVVRYSYLWRREALANRDEGSKDRPCAIVIAIDEGPEYRRVYVLPITHSKPDEGQEGIEIPSQTRKRLGLDGDRSWIVLTEANVFEWAGPDLRMAHGGAPGSAVFGTLPPNLFRAVRDRFVALARERRTKLVQRS